MKSTDSPMQNIDKALAAPRCHARSKRTGLPCKAPAVRGWKVCRMHGAHGGSKSGIEASRYIHGGRTKEAEKTRKTANRLRREFTELIS